MALVRSTVFVAVGITVAIIATLFTGMHGVDVIMR